MKSQPLVSIVTVDYNQPQVTRELLESLEIQDWTNLEVILVDNGSKIPVRDVIGDEFSFVKYVRSDQNLGFAGGNNLGITHASGDFVFFVNNDTEIPAGTIADLVHILESDESIGAINPLIYYHERPHLTQYAGYTPVNPMTGRNEAIGYKQNIRIDNQLKQTPFIHGAAVMLRREVIEQVGGMPEGYFLYYEELDWGAQIRQAGYKLLVSYRSAIFHKESVSTGKASPLKTYFQTRNRILFIRRNFGVLNQLLFLLYFFFVAMPKNVLQHIWRHQWAHLGSFLNGVWWHLAHGKESNRIGYKFDYLRG